MKKKEAFTIIELLVVISIIALMCVLAIPMLDLFGMRKSVEYSGNICLLYTSPSPRD